MTNPPAVHYKQGVIYTAIKARKFRAIKVRGNYLTEASAGWGKSAVTKKAAWGKCVKAIEDHKP